MSSQPVYVGSIVSGSFKETEVIGATTSTSTSAPSNQGGIFAAEQFYPTPPPSPALNDAPTLPCDTVEEPSPPVNLNASLPSVSIAIPLLLDTPHSLPHAAGLRLAQPKSLLATLGGNRVLALDPYTTVWDRMPYSATTATVATPNAVEEDSVEALVGGEKPQPKMHGLHWAMRKQKSTEHISSIFVQPPTPERIESPTSETPPYPSIAAVASSSQASAAKSVPIISPRTSPNGSPKLSATTGASVPPLHVLPEVRSPPRRSIAMAADSLQLVANRGRRPRLFGFTELSDSGGSSAASSRAASPEQTNEPNRPLHHVSFQASPDLSSSRIASSVGGPSTFIPRRHPVRARSEAALTAAAKHVPPRRRENGLKLNFEGIVPLPQPAEIQSASIISPYSAKLIRKKSGEILKSALKFSGPLGPNGTPLAAPPPPLPQSVEKERLRFESKSCPSTPSCPKYVHFDAQLERVKLFLHDQKPQVVSRDGSPTADTTSEGDEYPFPSTDDEKDQNKVLQVSLPNFPTSHPPDADLYLESLFLDDDRKTLKGVIVCKNLAFHKWVAVRFTFDWWQTTSEVTAAYKDSIKGGQYDRFSFSIKLHDILSKIEEKTLFLAIRYNSDGRDMWDSNGGQNYQVLFQKVAPAPSRGSSARSSLSIQPGMGKAVGGRTSQWSVTGGNDDDRLADLRAKLDRLSAEETDHLPVSPTSSRHFSFSPRRGSSDVSPNGSPMRSFSAFDTKTSDLPAAGPALAARYDFTSALKTTRRNSNSPSGRPVELPDMRTGLLNYGQRVHHGHAATEFYSPKFSPATVAKNDYFFSPPTNNATPLPVPDVTVEGPSPPGTDASTPTAASTYAPASAPVFGTAKEAPVTLPSVPLPRPISPIRPVATFNRSQTYPVKKKFTIDDSVESSPNVSPPQLDTSDSTATASPAESPRSPPELTLAKWSPTSGSDKLSDDASSASYSSIIEQFCWGGDPSAMTPRRSHSASSLDNYFAHPASGLSGGATPRAGADIRDPTTPSGNSSFYTSYTATPTTREDLDHVDAALSGHISSTPPLVC